MRATASLMLATAIFATPVVADERPLDGNWRVGARAFFDIGYGNGIVETSPGAAVSVGRALSPASILFLNYEHGRENLEGNRDSRTAKGISATYQRWINRRNGLSPYWLASVGSVRSDNNSESISGPMAALGFGASLPTSVGELYGELRSTHRFYRDTFDSNNDSDGTENLLGLSIGMLWGLGGERQDQSYYDAPEELAYEPEEQNSGVSVGPYIVRFDTNRSNLDKEDIRKLDEAVEYFLRGEGRRQVIQISGHTDWVGSARYNQQLSVRRAANVRRYLVNSGIDPARIMTIGRGEKQPLANNQTAAGRAANRRVTVAKK